MAPQQKTTVRDRKVLNFEKVDRVDGYDWKVTMRFTYTNDTHLNWSMSGSLSRNPTGLEWKTDFNIEKSTERRDVREINPLYRYEDILQLNSAVLLPARQTTSDSGDDFHTRRRSGAQNDQHAPAQRDYRRALVRGARQLSNKFGREPTLPNPPPKSLETASEQGNHRCQPHASPLVLHRIMRFGMHRIHRAPSELRCLRKRLHGSLPRRLVNSSTWPCLLCGLIRRVT
jgi:hypothetical protein